VSEPPDDPRPRFLRELRPLPAPRTAPSNGAAPGQATAYVRAAFAAELAALQATPEGRRNDQLNIAALNMGQLVASGHLPELETRDALYQMGVSVGLTETETRATVASGMSKGLTQPRVVPAPSSSSQPIPPVTVLDPAEPDDPDASWPARLDWHDLWKADADDEDWIVEPLIPARRLVALYSPPKIGKSLLMLELAVAIARGMPVLDFKPERPRRVLYIDLENDPKGDVRTRLQQMGHRPEELDLLDYLSFPELPNLDTMLGGLRLLEVVEHYGSEVVVVDTIGRIVGGEENDNDTWLSFYRHTGKAMKAAGLTLVRLDHTGKDASKGMRGGSAKYGDVDLVWSMALDGDSTLTLECTHQRLPVPQRTVVLHRLADPWLHHELQLEGKRAAVAAAIEDAIRFIDSVAGADVQLGVNDALALLRKHGRGVHKSKVGAIVRARDLRWNQGHDLLSPGGSEGPSETSHSDGRFRVVPDE
jgi:hypothetical protein